MASHQMATETQQELRRLPGNNRCVDCDAPYPQWATVSYGTFMCLECSGRHRGLGVHISFVRSVTMDSWTDKQISQMQRGGNETFREAFAAAGVPTTLSIQQKYNTPQAEAYRQRLTAIVEGRAPVPLPRWDPSCIASSSSSSGHGTGVGDTRGVEALKGETEQDYVARQLRLREEARARMQAKFGSGGMQGIGSGGQTGSYSSSSGAGGITDLSSAFGYLSTTVTSVAGSAVNLVRDQDLGTKVAGGWSYVQNAIADPALKDNVKSTASTGWSALATGATAVWKTAQSAVGAESDSHTTFHGGLAPSGKYSGMSNDEAGYKDRRDFDNDSWLDSQLGHGSSPVKSNSFGGSATIKNSNTKPVSHSNSFTSSSSSYNGLSSTKSSTIPPPPVNATATSLASPPLPPAAPTPTPAAPPADKKKDVDFFAEFGF